jgi:radical SAM superfamily enzyme YgiQ (UPF0313 family)
MEKGTCMEQIAAARENLRREGIRACYFLQFGYPGELWGDIQETVDLVRSTRPDDIGISVSYPLPGTKFFDRVRSELGKKTNWSDSEDLSMMFRGTYTDQFYRALHDALHAEVDQWKIPVAGDGEQQGRKAESLWRQVMRLEKTCRNISPTVLDTKAAGNLVQLQSVTAVDSGSGPSSALPHESCP